MENNTNLFYNIKKDELAFLLSGFGLDQVYGFLPDEVSLETPEEEVAYVNLTLFHLIQKDYVEIEENESKGINILVKEPVKTGIHIIEKSKSFLLCRFQDEEKAPFLVYLAEEEALIVELPETRENDLSCSNANKEQLLTYLEDNEVLIDEEYVEEQEEIDPEQDAIIFTISICDRSTGEEKAKARFVENAVTDYLITNENHNEERTIYHKNNFMNWIISWMGGDQ